MRGCVDGDTLGRAHAKLRAALRVLLPLSSLHSVIRCFLSSVFDSGDLFCRCYTMRPVEKERNASDDIVFYARTTKVSRTRKFRRASSGNVECYGLGLNTSFLKQQLEFFFCLGRGYSLHFIPL